MAGALGGRGGGGAGGGRGAVGGGGALGGLGAGGAGGGSQVGAVLHGSTSHAHWPTAGPHISRRPNDGPMWSRTQASGCDPTHMVMGATTLLPPGTR